MLEGWPSMTLILIQQNYNQKKSAAQMKAHWYLKTAWQ